MYQIGPSAIGLGGGFHIVGDGPLLVWQLRRDLIIFLRQSPEALRLFAQYVKSEGRDLVVITTCIEDDKINPFLIETIMGLNESRSMLTVTSRGHADVLFIDTLGRPLLSARITFDNPVAACLFSFDQQPLPSCRNEQHRIIAVANQRFISNESALIDMDAVIEIDQSGGYIDTFLLARRSVLSSWKLQPTSAAREVCRHNDGHELERDVAQVLLHSFSSHQVLLNPHKSKDGKELCDVLIITAEDILIVQTKKRAHNCVMTEKDSSRRIAQSKRHIRAALSQAKGAWREFASGPVCVTLTDDRSRLLMQTFEPISCYKFMGDSIEISNKALNFHLLIVANEVYPENINSLSDDIADVSRSTKSSVLVLDLDEVVKLVLGATDTCSFFAAFDATSKRRRCDAA